MREIGNEMKILAVGDMHLKATSLAHYAPARIELVRLCTQVQPDYIVLLGDQLDGHTTQHTTCVVTITGVLEDLASIARVIMLVGNHDMLDNQQYCSAMHPFNSMKHIPNVEVVERPTVIQQEGEVSLIYYARLLCRKEGSNKPWTITCLTIGKTGK